MCFNMFSESATGAPKAIKNNIIIIVVFFLERLKVSIAQATGVSKSESIAPVDATAARIKKAPVKICPAGIESNTAGIVIKSNPGPELGSKPKENTTGKIAIPERSDTTRSNSITFVAI